MPENLRTTTLGIIADTPIPDRARELPPNLIPASKKSKVDLILHAGDACSWKVYHELAKVAHVKIVQGNRDWFLGMRTPKFESLLINQVPIILAHGHYSILHYTLDKWIYLRKGYNFTRYYQTLVRDFPKAKIIIFGHTHHQIAQWVNGQLFFNPGAAYPCKYNQYNPQYGLISLTPGGEIRTEFHNLE